jgi:S1-C subfamily serine protease
MYRTAWTLALAASLAAAPAPAGADEKPHLADALALEEAMTEVIKRAEPSIACILVTRSESVDAQKQLGNPDLVPEAYGSGVVIDEKGLILTNLHVVRDATRVYVRLAGGKGGFAEVYAGDPRSDLAVLRLVDPPLPPLKVLRFGDGGAVRKGQFAISLANPFAAGFRDGSPSASWGIISNLRRRAPSRPVNPKALDEERNYRTLHEFGTLIQADARLNLGCSGGALLNLKGEMIGLSTSQAAISGGETPGGFAVPMDDGMRRIIDVLKRGEEVEYGFLGIQLNTRMVRPQPGGDGVLVDHVIAGSPAWAAGLRGGGEYILSVNGTKVQEPDDLFLALGTLLASSTAEVQVRRPLGAAPETVKVRLAKFYVPGKIIASKRPDAIGGLRVDYTSVLFLRPGGPQIYAHGIPPGVMIREVVAGSAADAARLQEAKVITKVNGRDVNTPDEFYREMRNATGSVELTLLRPDMGDERVKIDVR